MPCARCWRDTTAARSRHLTTVPRNKTTLTVERGSARSACQSYLSLASLLDGQPSYRERRRPLATQALVDWLTFRAARTMHPSLCSLAKIPGVAGKMFKRGQLGLFDGKVKRYGNNVPDSHHKTRRSWLPNIQNKKLWSEALNQHLRMKVTTSALRTIDKCGGLDRYLFRMRDDRLGLYGVQLRNKIASRYQREHRRDLEPFIDQVRQAEFKKWRASQNSGSTPAVSSAANPPLSPGMSVPDGSTLSEPRQSLPADSTISRYRVGRTRSPTPLACATLARRLSSAKKADPSLAAHLRGSEKPSTPEADTTSARRNRQTHKLERTQPHAPALARSAVLLTAPTLRLLASAAHHAKTSSLPYQTASFASIGARALPISTGC
ncbi:uncharacterized protein L969DRAFT_47173 [Mixia osmundae IAM 14324]|uniref:uncharacterized protein n=1 Tax=Mixia osmundae (strain CBS 9802 / IAM 14324 / JCM 22182 / KY 12970) TaxID=764103 RepID=UPI0004A54DBF|nr:uncharacterized protein L969DRAFT_47173 [Mixia osmundae IAM 14324]KEI40341.1 hypothetical protein L969DRAFT_47173 [Mixia osmundae IAM 14324]